MQVGPVNSVQYGPVGLAVLQDPRQHSAVTPLMQTPPGGTHWPPTSTQNEPAVPADSHVPSQQESPVGVQGEESGRQLAPPLTQTKEPPTFTHCAAQQSAELTHP
jgi:hypothetical protein